MKTKIKGQTHLLENLYMNFSPKLNVVSCYEYY